MYTVERSGPVCTGVELGFQCDVAHHAIAVMITNFEVTFVRL